MIGISIIIESIRYFKPLLVP